MSDGWSDQRKRTMNNFLVNSPADTVFLSSVDTTDISKTVQKLFELLDGIMKKIGKDNIVQVFTDNASNYKAARKILMEKRKRLFWTPCAAHCTDLMLEDVQKFDSLHKVIIQKAISVVTYIYSWGTVINWMKQLTNGKELIRPRVTRFATSNLTMRRLSELKGNLFTFFSSDKWKTSEDQLSHHLHAVGYYLNSQFQYSPDFRSDANIKRGLYDCIAKMVPESSERVKIDLQLDDFRHANGLFGHENVVLTRNKNSPTDWWESYDDECPELNNFAIRILNLTCNSSGISHSNDLVFVMYNLKLKERQRQK
ncbi:unnamed protein product [Coffea canephora]|uniref:DUF659 domain-containing protein n=1 Tax=Coffea canephora TaxID=49390 RepID=A0A068UI67_COFCA|nr:unnamed protein product [Coffea canephora]